MTKQSVRLSKNDYRFLMGLLNKAGDEADAAIEIGGENKRAASLKIRQITHIRLALIDLEK